MFAEHGDNSTSVTDVYDFDGNLGEGAFGRVMKAHIKNCPSITRAVKQVAKGNRARNTAVQREVGILRLLDHPAICKIYETFESTDSIYLIMEYIQGRELFDEIEDSIRSQTFNSERCACIMRQVFSGLEYVHSVEIIHRDLKPENIMVVEHAGGKLQVPTVKIIDFGLAVLNDGAHDFQSKKMEGTLMYLAPETEMHRHFSAASDMWSTGIIVFILNMGRFPTPWGIQTDIKSIQSPDAQDLISGLLKDNPKDRLTAAEAKLHRWVAESEETKSKRMMCKENSLHEAMAAFSEFYKTDRLQRAAYTALALQTSGQQIERFQMQFASIDKDNNGVITRDDLIEAFEKDPPGHVRDVHAWVDCIFNELDSDGSGVLEFTEWVAACYKSMDSISEEAMQAAFRAMDTNHSGYLNLSDLGRLMQLSEEELSETVSRVDTNGDGQIDFEEFKAMLENHAPAVDSWSISGLRMRSESGKLREAK